MTIQRRSDGMEPLRPEPVGRLGRAPHEHPATTRGHLAAGTLACPCCDAPVALGAGALAPAALIGCPFCGHAGAVRTFLSLETPTRPAWVDVRVVHRGRP